MNARSPRTGGTWGSWSLSILLHLAIVGIAVGAYYWSQRSKPPAVLGIEGSVVTAEDLAQRNAPPSPEPPPPAPEPEPEPLPEAEPEPEPVAEQPAEDAAAVAAEAARVAEERRVADERLAAERKAAEIAAQQQADRERVARERAEKERVERERAAKEKAEQEKQERERLARERTERERREREEAERARRESELASQLAAEQQRAAVRNSPQANQYRALITNRIMNAWVRPPSARVGLVCEVRVTQVEGGTVTNVQIGRCNGDEVVRQSIEAAVYRASPLPSPPDPALFERELIVTFRPEN